MLVRCIAVVAVCILDIVQCRVSGVELIVAVVFDVWLFEGRLRCLRMVVLWMGHVLQEEVPCRRHRHCCLSLAMLCLLTVLIFFVVTPFIVFRCFTPRGVTHEIVALRCAVLRIFRGEIVDLAFHSLCWSSLSSLCVQSWYQSRTPLSCTCPLCCILSAPKHRSTHAEKKWHVLSKHGSVGFSQIAWERARRC